MQRLQRKPRNLYGGAPRPPFGAIRQQVRPVILAVLLLPAGVARAQDAGSPGRLTVINHARTAVHAVAATCSAEALYQLLGLAVGTPLTATRSGGGTVPLAAGEENGCPVVRAYLSLAGAGRMDFDLSAATHWTAVETFCSAGFDLAAGTGRIDNGVLRLTYRSGRWSLGFCNPGEDAAGQAEDLSILDNCHLDAWLDTEKRGRLMSVAPGPLGLVHADSAVLSGGEAKVLADGSATLTLVKEFGGEYRGVTLTETFTLAAGKPWLSYDPVFANRGDAPRYVAYVDLGAGLRARYGRLMQAEPVLKYEDPRHTRPILLSGNASSYTRVSWRPEVCWVGVESGLGCGIGVSTMRDIRRQMIGATVWNFSGKHEFLACLLQAERSDPQDGGNCPLEIPPGGILERVGLALVASCGDVDIRRQTRNLFGAMAAGRSPEIQTSCAVYVNGQPLVPAEVETFDRPELLAGNGAARYAALDMAFSRPYRLTARCEQASPANPLAVLASPLRGGGSPIAIMTLASPEEKTVDFTAATGWLGKRMAFLLRIEGADGAVPARLELAPAPLAAPELSSPADKLSLTDLALFFRWQGIAGALDYELQMARDPEFKDPVTFRVRSEIEWPIYMPTDSELPGPGLWHWRVRGVSDGTPGQWSAVRSMVVGNDHAKKPPAFRIAAEHPLFTFEGFLVSDWSKFKDTIPADIRPFVAFNSGEKFALIEHLRPLHENGQRVFIRTHHPSPITSWTPLADVEEAFQKYPNVMGIMGGETLSVAYHGGEMGDYSNRLLKLCGKYGRFFYEADGTYPGEDKWEALYARRGSLMHEYRDYLIFAQKNNILHRQFLSQSSVLGLYLSGAIANQGAWEDGGWYWQQVGFKKLGEIFGQRGGDVKDMPRIFYSLNFLMGVGRGCSVFSLEGQTGVANVGQGYRIAERGLPSANSSAYYTTEGELTPSFVRFTEPFIRGVIGHNLIPTREQVLAQTRLAVYNDGVAKANDGDPYYYQWEPLYRGTYGFRTVGLYPGTLMEFFPNTGRYRYIPVFPQGRAELPGVKTLPLSELQDADTVRRIFDQAYPAWYEGDALVQLVGDTLAVMNSHENTDHRQRYAVPLPGRGGFLKIAGTVETHAYLMGKFEDGNQRLWLHANAEYPERETAITLTLEKTPKTTVTPADAAKRNHWNPETGTLTLILCHASGAVEVEVTLQ